MFASCDSGRLPHILRKEHLGAYPGLWPRETNPGLGAFHSSGKIGHLGAYPGVGACPGEDLDILLYNVFYYHAQPVRYVKELEKCLSVPNMLCTNTHLWTVLSTTTLFGDSLMTMLSKRICQQVSLH